MGALIKRICLAFRSILLKLFGGGAVKFGKNQNIHPKAKIVVYNQGKVVFGNDVSVAQNCMVYADENAELVLEDNTSLSRGVQLYCREKIVVGAGTMIGNNTLVFDHDHDFRCPGGIRAGKYKSAPIIIGKNVWIGCNVTILRGTNIGDNCVVGAGTVLKGSFSDNSLIYEKRDVQAKRYVIENI